MRRIAVLVSVVLGAAIATTSSAKASGPTALGVDSTGVSYVGFANGGKILRLGSDGAPLAPWGTPGSAAGQLGAVLAIDVAPGSSGNVWVLDSNRRVQEFTRSGDYVRGVQLSLLSTKSVGSPTDVFVDAFGVLHVSDIAADVIQCGCSHAGPCRSRPPSLRRRGGQPQLHARGRSERTYPPAKTLVHDMRRAL